ncbi:MAG: hypothetical protein ACTSSE_19645 [Candidatus Thorarchaeota archaeon]
MKQPNGGIVKVQQDMNDMVMNMVDFTFPTITQRKWFKKSSKIGNQRLIHTKSGLHKILSVIIVPLAVR